MNSSTNPRKRVKVKLLRAEDLLWDLMETIGVLLVEQSQVALGVQEVLVTGDHLVEDLEVQVVQACHHGEDLVLDRLEDRPEDHLEDHLVDHLAGQWEDHLGVQLEHLVQEECPPGGRLEGQVDHLELEGHLEDRLAGHLVVCPHRGWLDLEGHQGDLLECHRGVWLPHLGLVMPLSLASGLNIQLQMVKGIITTERLKNLFGKSPRS